MIFKQLYEELSSTYTYLVGCEETGQAVLIDPVYPSVERDLHVINSLGLKLVYSIDTHIHADHITSAKRLKELTGSKIIYPVTSQCECPDFRAEEGRPIEIGGVTIDPLYTPGHTDDHYAYKIDNRVLTGDALLIDGCGRTDFQNGDAEALYKTVREKLFALPDDTLVFPAHDYNHRHVSSIAQEKERNPRLGGETSLEEFKQIMANLNLAYPKFIDHAVPGNTQCGVCPEDLPEKYDEYCAEMTESIQG
ncbi:MAG: MBL fold metallo-hydrolase [Pseudomonadales bacterium]|jgi:glyoxylase-like metal-dependent hydrolase (beta-lactamase superfamily II)|nr:MBL fold metallo-hydrolase [Pseudomonadales bacterium]